MSKKSFACALLIRLAVSLFFGLAGVGAVLAQVPVITAISGPRQVVPWGQSLSLAVTANSATPVSYQWKRSGRPLAGATAASYGIASAGAADRGWYQVVATNASGATVSAVMFVNVATSPGQIAGFGISADTPDLNHVSLLGDFCDLAISASNVVYLRMDGTVGQGGDARAGSPPAGLTDVVAIAAGTFYRMALKSDGTVVTWGDPPAAVPAGLVGVVAIAAGGSHFLALKADGTVTAWGSGPDGVATSPSLTGIVDVAAGAAHNLALRADGTVTAWGSNGDGQISVPAGLAGVVALATKYNHNLALKADGTVVAWGASNWGQTAVPAGLAGVVAVAAGLGQSVALKGDGTVIGWGDFAWDQIAFPDGLRNVTGIGAAARISTVLRRTTGDAVPTITSPPAGVAVLLGGTATFSVVASGGTAPVTYQWRKDGTPVGGTASTLTITDVTAAHAGEYDVVVSNYLGFTTSAKATLSITPSGPAITAISAPRQVVTAGQNLVLTVTATGATSYQWKRNGLPVPGASGTSLGIVGAGAADRGWYQVVATNSTGATKSAAVHVNVVFSPAQIVAWGRNTSGQTDVPLGLTSLCALAAGDQHALALKSDGTLATFGALPAGGTLNVPAGLANIVAIAAGGGNSGAVRSDSTVVVWGDAALSAVPSGLSGVAKLAIGRNHALALKSDGTVVAWGTSGFGTQAGVAALTEVADIAAGGGHSLVLKSDGTVIALGGSGGSEVTVPAGLTNVVAVAAGSGLSIALRADGSVVAWGTADGRAVVPAGLAGVVEISANGGNAIARKADGTVVTWGVTTMGANAPPAGLTGVVGVAAGQEHSLAFRPTIGATLAIVSHPSNQVAGPGQSASFNAGASAGNAVLSYQWRKDGTALFALPGRNSATLTLTDVQERDLGAYDVVVNDGVTSVTSNAATLTFGLVPFFTTQPAGVRLDAGQNVTLSAAAAGNPAPAYQWRKNGAGIPGATTSSLTLSNVSASDAGDYLVVALNVLGGATSSVAKVIVGSGPPIITAQSAPLQHVAAGQSLALSVTATGASSYLWLRHGVAVPGATSPTFTITNASTGDNGWYHAVVTNAAGSAVSRVIHVNRHAAIGALPVYAWGNDGYGIVPGSVGTAGAIAAGADHNLAVRADGTVVAWNAQAALAVPAGLGGVGAVSSGSGVGGAVKADGALALWTASDGASQALPAGLAGVVKLSIGGGQRLALKADGSVVAWGTPEAATAVPVGLAGVVDIAAGQNHCLAVKADGTVVGWGAANAYGESKPPDGLGGVIAVAAGNLLSVALRADGTVVAWGYNGNGQSSVPGGLSDIVAIAARNNRVLALKANGTVVAWGAAAQWDVPSGLDRVAAIAIAGTAAAGHAIALRHAAGAVAPAITAQPSDQTVALGGGATFTIGVSAASLPVQYTWRKDGQPVAGATQADFVLPNAAAADAGFYEVIVSNSLGTVISNPAMLSINLPAVVVGPPAAGSRHTLFAGQSLDLTLSAAIGASATVQWKRNGFLIPGATARNFSIINATRAYAGYYQAVYNDGAGAVTSPAVHVLVAPVRTQVIGWPDISDTLAGPDLVSGTAREDYFRVGLRRDGSIREFVAPIDQKQPAGSDFVALSNNRYCLYALRANGTVVTWRGSRPEDEPPAGLNDVVAISGGHAHALAVRGDGTVVALGTAGWNETSIPAGLANVVAVAAGWGTSAALRADGTVVTWGRSEDGQLNIPAGLAHVVRIAAGERHFLALKSDGTVVAWGYDGYGQATVPAGLSNVIDVEGAMFQSRALKADGTVVTWGRAGGQYAPPPGVPNVVSITNEVTLRDATADTRPVITTQPASITVDEGTTASFTVGATGAGFFTYRWRKAGSLLPGQTTAMLRLANVTSASADSYDVVVSTGAGSAVSQAATLVVNYAPVITAPPGNRTVTQGDSFSLSVGASAHPAPTYQWRKDGVDLPGATNPALPFVNVTAAAAGAYVVVVSNAMGSTSSVPVGLIVETAPVITTPPVSQTVLQGQAATFSVVAQGMTSLFYQWRKGGANIAGATASTYTIPLVSPEDAGDYDVRVTNVHGSALTGVATLTVAPAPFAPVFNTQPQSRTVLEGDSVSLSVQVSANPAPTFRWRKGGAAMTDGGFVTGTTTSTLHVASAALGDEGSYDVAVANTQGSGISNAAILIVNKSPVFTQQPVGLSATEGSTVSFNSLVAGKPAPTYQWRRDSFVLAGATGASLTLSSVTPADAGHYTVVATNAVGTRVSNVATLEVAYGSALATQVAEGYGYVPGHTLVVTNILNFGSSSTSLGWNVLLPDGWSFVSDTAASAGVKPAAGDTSILDWAWSVPPPSPVMFTYRLQVPSDITGEQQIAALAIVRRPDSVVQVLAHPDPLRLARVTYHSADTSLDGHIDLFELTRAIELFNTRHGTVRTGAYRIEPAGEDGFAAEPARSLDSPATLARYHSADTNRDGALSLFELTRVIELFNTRRGTVRTGQYHLKPGSEDGFAPGP